MAKPRARPVDDPAQQAAASVRALWEAGRRSKARVDARPESGEAAYRYPAKGDVRAEEARLERLNPDTLAKAWRVADEYTEAQVEELCRKIVRRGAPFGATHLIRLLRVPDRAARKKLETVAVSERWGVVALQRAIMAAQGRRPGVARRPKVPTNLNARLTALACLADKWERWCAAAGPGLPKNVLAAVQRATAAVRAAKVAAERKLPPPAARDQG